MIAQNAAFQIEFRLRPHSFIHRFSQEVAPRAAAATKHRITCADPAHGDPVPAAGHQHRSRAALISTVGTSGALRLVHLPDAVNGKGRADQSGGRVQAKRPWPSKRFRGKIGPRVEGRHIRGEISQPAGPFQPRHIGKVAKAMTRQIRRR